MDIDRDIAKIAEQERELCFDRFTLEDAALLGEKLKQLASERSLPIAIDVSLISMPAYYVAMPGSIPDNPNWVRRKRNVVFRFFQSSYAVGRSLARDGKTVTEKWGIPEAEFACHGGCFPITVRGVGVIGSVTVSGLPQRDDHNLVVEALCDILGKDHEALKLAAV